MTLIDKLEETDRQALKSLLSTLVSNWNQRHEHVPSVLYHYTSAEGLIGILTSKSIWATELRYMNDLSELQYAKGLIEERLGTRLSSASLSDIQLEFIERTLSVFDPFGHGNSIFSVSFCENGNLLSQWRAYRGQGGGYALGIDFFHTLRFLDKPCVLRRIIYKEEDQVKLIDSTIDAFLLWFHDMTLHKSLDDVTSTVIPAAYEAFSIVAGEYMFSLKHPDFHEEKEWRLVHSATISPTFNRDGDLPLFRSFQGNLIPYMTIGFKNAIDASHDDAFGMAFPIVRINVGPTINAELNLESLRTMLLTLNPDIEPFIKKSEIPLRWL